MANPILSRTDVFARPSGSRQNAPRQGGWPQQGQGQWGAPQYPTQQPTQGVMTLEDVIVKTSVALGLVVAMAAVTWWGFMFGIIPAVLLTPVLIVSAIVGFVTVLIVAFRRTIPVAGVIAYSLIEGVFIGAFSLLFETMYPGIVMQAVLGTFAAAGATLAAYKFFNIQVTPKFRKMVFITTAAFAGVMLINLGLAFAGIDTGLRSVGGGFNLLGFGAALLGAGLGVFNLIVDFDYVERGIQNRAPESESWRAAFGITVTMVWLYTEILRILSYLRR